MAVINAGKYSQQELIKILNNMTDDDIEITGLCGQRYLACGWKNHKRLILQGVPGNNLAAFADGPEITVYGNAQEGVGNTMSSGSIQIHGRVGDIAGYGMRGGELLVKEDAGYRLGIHMKAYQEHKPVIVVGGSVGAFAGEYMAGGTMIVLGLNNGHPLVGPYCGTGMYGGEIYLRGDYPVRHIASNIEKVIVSGKELDNIIDYLYRYSIYFKYPLEKILDKPFTRLTVENVRPFAGLYAGFVS